MSKLIKGIKKIFKKSDKFVKDFATITGGGVKSANDKFKKEVLKCTDVAQKKAKCIEDCGKELFEIKRKEEKKDD